MPKTKQPKSPQKKKTQISNDVTGFEFIEIYGAREHNLKDINLKIPRNQLITITGISGSGKSSLAFDTLYAEGQRRYMESFSAYARSFMGDMRRPDVDKINGLSPVISIEQKTTSKNPRSTVGTTTEIYDFFRLLFARAGKAYSYLSGNEMKKQSEDQIIDSILERFSGKKIQFLAPIVKGRKGHYRELFVQIRKWGFSKVRIDGKVTDIEPKMQLDRYKIHDIEIVVDRLKPSSDDRKRCARAVETSLKRGKDVLIILDEENKTHTFSKALVDEETGLSYDEPAPNSFSFNSPYGACPKCNGLGTIQEFSEATILPDRSKSIASGALIPLGEYRDIWIFKKVEALLKRYKGNISTPVNKLSEKALEALLHGDGKSVNVRSVKYPGTDWNTKFNGIVPYLEEQYHNGTEKMKEWVADFLTESKCPECNGGRLKQEALHFKIGEKNIAELSQLDISSLGEWLEGLEDRLDEKQKIIGHPVLKEIRKRVGFLLDVGLDYLNMDRPLKTLSGGEAQRIRLATQIGTQLVNVLYIMDEPSIGLHQRDNQRLINALKQLRDIGNSVIIVEHDKDMMLASDYIIDIGPGAGRHGGRVVAEGEPSSLLKQHSLTSAYLSEHIKIEVPKKRREGLKKSIKIIGAKGNNLQNVNCEIPLGKMICITGVSGSGKSTLIRETLYPALRKKIYKSLKDPLAHDKISGMKEIDKVIEVDQSPIGRTPRSNPATYTGVFTDIRALFSELPESKIRGYKPGRFSFNVKGGRCETCQGGGMRLIEMDFLPDVYVPCETCKGKRYNRETLEIRYKGKSISDVLEMTVEDAVQFFEFQPKILRKIETLNSVGLGYIALGQHATTLSGGEAQRVKLSTELSKKDTGQTLYILDEPTTGLHFQDIQHLLDVLQKLVDKGNTVLVIEHNMDVIKVADHIIDIGPEGGRGGGKIVAEGTPEKVAQSKNSYTARYLMEELK